MVWSLVGQMVFALAATLNDRYWNRLEWTTHSVPGTRSTAVLVPRILATYRSGIWVLGIGWCRVLGTGNGGAGSVELEKYAPVNT